ncbi:LPXTG cell wall anchor domain-containing protein [Ilumatobacter sp.]|uniref:LPXTG cell wall anchor domain-containing protein n=1 Tax=Ilumatobacter sp. TaxID=1967498 RepID=UPI003C50B94D
MKRIVATATLAAIAGVSFAAVGPVDAQVVGALTPTITVNPTTLDTAGTVDVDASFEVTTGFGSTEVIEVAVTLSGTEETGTLQTMVAGPGLHGCTTAADRLSYSCTITDPTTVGTYSITGVIGVAEPDPSVAIPFEYTVTASAVETSTDQRLPIEPVAAAELTIEIAALPLTVETTTTVIETTTTIIGQTTTTVPPATELPATGVDNTWLTVLAVVLLGLGTGAVSISRRRA